MRGKGNKKVASLANIALAMLACTNASPLYVVSYDCLLYACDQVMVNQHITCAI